MASRHGLRGSALGIAAAFLLACTGNDRGERDQAPAGADTGDPASERAGADEHLTIAAETIRARLPQSASRRRASPPTDADHHLLRDLVDHHEGMILLAHAAMEREHGRHGGDDPALAADSYRDLEKQRVRALLDSLYGDAFEPVASATVRAEIDSILRLDGDAFKGGFAEFSRRYHRETIAMIDRALSGLRRTPVIMLARQIRDRHAKELSVLDATGSY